MIAASVIADDSILPFSVRPADVGGYRRARWWQHLDEIFYARHKETLALDSAATWPDLRHCRCRANVPSEKDTLQVQSRDPRHHISNHNDPFNCDRLSCFYRYETPKSNKTSND